MIEKKTYRWGHEPCQPLVLKGYRRVAWQKSILSGRPYFEIGAGKLAPRTLPNDNPQLITLLAMPSVFGTHYDMIGVHAMRRHITDPEVHWAEHYTESYGRLSAEESKALLNLSMTFNRVRLPQDWAIDQFYPSEMHNEKFLRQIIEDHKDKPWHSIPLVTSIPR